MMKLGRGAQQCGILVVHIAGWGGKSALTSGDSPLQDHTEVTGLQSRDEHWPQPSPQIQP